MGIRNNRKHALAAVYLLPFPMGILLQFLALKIDIIGQSFFEYWYPFGVIAAILIVSLPSYCLIAELPAFVAKRKFFAVIFTASLIVLMPIVSLVNVVTVCAVEQCTMSEGEDLNGN